MSELKDIKPGDKVIRYRGAASQRTVEVVDRVTNTQVIIKSNRYSKTTGYQVGATGFGRPRIGLATPELIAEIKLKQEVSFLTDYFRFKPEHLNDREKVDKVMTFLKENGFI